MNKAQLRVSLGKKLVDERDVLLRQFREREGLTEAAKRQIDNDIWRLVSRPVYSATVGIGSQVTRAVEKAMGLTSDQGRP